MCMFTYLHILRTFLERYSRHCQYLRLLLKRGGERGVPSLSTSLLLARLAFVLDHEWIFLFLLFRINSSITNIQCYINFKCTIQRFNNSVHYSVFHHSKCTLNPLHLFHPHPTPSPLAVCSLCLRVQFLVSFLVHFFCFLNSTYE